MAHHACSRGPLVLFLWVLCLSAGPVHAQTGRPLTAEQEALRAGHIEQGRQLWRARRYTESAAAYRRATRAAPDDARSYAGLARAYAALGAHRFAVPAYRRAIELLSSAPPALHIALADSLLETGDPDGASAAYLLALRRDPANEAARRGYESLGRVERAASTEARAPAPLERPVTGRTSEAPSHGPGMPLVAGGTPLAIIGFAAAAGCATAYALPEATSTARAGTDSLSWIACLAVGAVTMSVGLVLLGVGLAQGVDAPAATRAAGDVQLDVAPRRGGAVASALVTF